MNPRKHSLFSTISYNIHFLGQYTLMAREQVISDQQLTGTPCNLIPALLGCIIKPWHSVFRVRPWIHDNWCSTVRWREACSAWWVPDPSCRKSCGQFKPWGMVAWARSVFGISQSWRVQVNHALLLSLSPFSPGHT
jgi:hypothetical protein